MKATALLKKQHREVKALFGEAKKVAPSQRERVLGEITKKLQAHMHEALAECVLNDPEAPASEMTEVILDELHSLRTERRRREETERLLEKHRIDSDLRLRALRSDTDTQLRELLAIAEDARAEAEKANRTKDEFLAMLSHGDRLK